MIPKPSSEKRSEPPVNDSGLSITQVMEMGQAAAKLLQSPIYNAVHQMAVNEALDHWSTTSPKEVQKRESLWQEVQAHGRAAEKAAELVARAEELLEKQLKEPEERQAEYVDNQGFMPAQFQ
tara:strand:+ start:772 stop:1137 length:366 start_codon:yes stop_codon:yes gene_type:complete